MTRTTVISLVVALTCLSACKANEPTEQEAASVKEEAKRAAPASAAPEPTAADGAELEEAAAEPTDEEAIGGSADRAGAATGCAGDAKCAAACAKAGAKMDACVQAFHLGCFGDDKSNDPRCSWNQVAEGGKEDSAESDNFAAPPPSPTPSPAGSSSGAAGSKKGAPGVRPVDVAD